MAIGLGPVARVVDYDPRWPRAYEDEKAVVLSAIGPWVTAIEHVGSTAIPGLAAKPIIDILVGLKSLGDAVYSIPRLGAIGYEYVPEFEKDLPERKYFHKGSPENRTHHVHMVEQGSDFWMSLLRFRNYLRDHPEDARRYEGLKRDLAMRFTNDRDKYTESKTDFVRSIVQAAAEAGY